MMRLCLVIPSLHPGGMERVMSELTWQFVKKKDVDVHLILYGIKRDIFYELPANVTIHRPNFQFNDKKRFRHSIRTLFFLRSKIKHLQPDSVLSFGEYWNNFVLLALWGLRINVFVSDRCQPDKRLGFVHDWLRRLLYPRAAGVIAQTAKAKQIYQSLFVNKNITVIGNPIRCVFNDELIGIEKENIVLTVGRLIKTKHHEALIRMFLRTKLPGWKLMIVGEDALKQNNMLRLKEVVRNLGAEESVVLAGKQKEINRFYKRSKIFAFTSSSEGFPNVIGEALAAGLPVVAYDCIAGPAEMISDGENGFLIPLFDELRFENALRLLMERNSLRTEFGLKAKTSVKRFSHDRISEEYFRFITTSMP